MKPMNCRFLTCCCLALLAATLPGCRKAPPPAAGPDEHRSAVTVAPVALAGITQRLELTGDVQPLSTVRLTSKMPGRLEKLGIRNEEGAFTPLSEGVRVRRGEVLAQIDLAVYETRLKQAQAAATMADAQWQDAAREEKRMLALFQDGSATEQVRDKAVTARLIAEAARAQAEALLALAKIDLEEATPRSPVDGVVTRKHVDEGNIVSAGMPLVTIEEVAQIKVVFGVPERYLAAIEPGRTRVRLASDALRGETIEAVVGKVYPTVEAATRNAWVEVVLDNADGRLRPGTFVHVALDAAQADNAVVIPLSAITWQGQEGFVFVAQDNQARRRPVKVGIREQERCQITEGLQPGELLVVEGFRNLRDGDGISTQEGARP